MESAVSDKATVSLPAAPFGVAAPLVEVGVYQLLCRDMGEYSDFAC